MQYKLLFLIVSLLISNLANAQTEKIILGPNVKLPTDSIISNQLLNALNAFMSEKDKPNEEIALIMPEQKVETFILIDEMKDIEKSGKYQDDLFYKPYLMNIVKISDNQYYLQLAYIGSDNNFPILRANFELIAHKTDDFFLFSSPLVYNTKHWKTINKEKDILHYESAINESKVKQYIALKTLFDKKLKQENMITELYCFDNILQLLRLIGVTYKSDYNGQVHNVFTSIFNEKQLIMLGNENEAFNNFDLHDLWHDRLSLVVSRKKVNRPIDEGYAYLYGGSWGVTWQDVLKEFRQKINYNDKTDWLNFKETQEGYVGNKGDKFVVDYIINALILKKIENEKGFAGVWEFLNCGPYEKGNENYFAALETLTSINKSNYNNMVLNLLDAEFK